MTSRVEHFRELLSEPPGSPDEEALLAPLDELAEALKRSGVGAATNRSTDGKRLHLNVWPLHRPAFASSILTLQLYGGKVIVSGSPSLAFSTPDELANWLEQFIQTSELRTTVATLKSLAMDPVDGRLERENGMATLVEVPAEVQAELASLQAGTTTLDLELQQREPKPDPTSLVRLRSAGLTFEIKSATLTGRKVSLVIERAD